MPISTAQEWITLDRVRSQLRVAPNYDADELSDILAAAVRRVEDILVFPILDAKWRKFVFPPGAEETRYLPSGAPLTPYSVSFADLTKEAPVRIKQRGVRGPVSISYWTPTQTRREEPSGTITPGRIEPGSYEKLQGQDLSTLLINNPSIYPPEAGWPEVLEGTPLVVTGNAGFDDVSEVPVTWKQATLALCSAQFESAESAQKFVMAAESLLEHSVPLGDGDGERV